MRATWGALTVCVLLVLPPMLPGAAAGNSDECVDSHVALVAGIGARASVCPDGASVEGNLGEASTELPNQTWVNRTLENVTQELPSGPYVPNPPEPGTPEVPGLPPVEPPTPPAPPGVPEPPEYDVFTCGQGNRGLQIRTAGHIVFACATWSVDPPSVDPGSHDPPGAGLCPSPDYGLTVTAWDSKLGVCYQIDFQRPDPGASPNPEVDVSSCRAGQDPAVFIFDGGVAFCLKPVVEVADPLDKAPPVDVSTEPCTARAVDPTITIGDGEVSFCVEAGVD